MFYRGNTFDDNEFKSIQEFVKEDDAQPHVKISDFSKWISPTLFYDLV